MARKKDETKEWLDADNETMSDEQMAAQEENDRRHAIDAIERFTNDEDEDEDDLGRISLRTILGGDILQSRFFLKQVAFIFFVVVLMLIYTGNRYSSQQDIIVIDSLNKQLQDECYNVLTQSSELTNMQRQSNLEELLRSIGDSTLLSAQTPPYEVK